MGVRYVKEFIIGILSTITIAVLMGLYNMSVDVAILKDRASSANSRLDGHDNQLR